MKKVQSGNGNTSLLYLQDYVYHIRLHKTLSHRSYSLNFFTLLILNFIYIFMYITMCLYITITSAAQTQRSLTEGAE